MSPADDGAQLLVDVRKFKSECLTEEGSYDNIVLATKLVSVGYRVRLREAVGGGTDCLHNLRHTFLYVWHSDAEPGTEATLVEPMLHDHFEIANPTEDYRAILDALPTEFVGSKESMIAVVQLLCLEMATAFTARGFLLPPWRQCRSMLSKWFPTHVKDHDVTPPVVPRIDSGSAFTAGGLISLRKLMANPEDEWIPFQYHKY